MPIIFHCSCGKKLSAQDQHAGFTIRCPACERDMEVPASSGAPAASRPRSEDRYDEPASDRPRRRFDHGPTTSGLAVASLIFGIVAFCLAPAGLVGIILAVCAFVSIGRSQGRTGGTGLAIGGLVASLIALAIVVPISWYAYQRVIQAGDRMNDANNLKQLGLGIHNYENFNKQFPAKGITLPDGKPLLSWRVAILPYIEHNDLFQKFHQDEPWDSPHNMQFLEQMPKVYRHPRRAAERPGWTYYQAFVGRSAVFDPMGRSSFVNITDGTSNTLMLAEATEAVPWTKPDDLKFDPTRCLGWAAGSATATTCSSPTAPCAGCGTRSDPRRCAC
jgi:hypothetical protein